MHYIYFLPKQVSLYSESKPWGYPLRIGFENKQFAEHYVEQLRLHGYKAFITREPSSVKDENNFKIN